MSFKSMEELCDELLKSKALDCSVCMNLLQPPVMTVEKHGNVCHSCYKKQKESGSVRLNACNESLCLATSHSDSPSFVAPNPALDSLLEKVDFACRYEYCSDRIRCKDYRTHLEYCRYRVIKCEVTDCEWEGMRRAYVDHYATEHEVDIIERDAYTIAGLKENLLKTNILQTSCGTLVSHVMLSEDMYSFLTCDIGHTSLNLSFKVFIKFSQGSNTYTVESNIVQSNKINGFVDSLAIQVNKNAVSLFFSKNPNIVWELKVDNEIEVADDILKKFKCLSCSELLSVPTYKCSSININTCNKCFIAEQNSCHTYMCSAKHIKDESLNTLLGKIRHPCKFRDKGCKVKCFSTVDHESTCSFYSWNCFICAYPVDFLDINAHFRFMHLNRYAVHTDVCVYGYLCQTKNKRYIRNAYARFFVTDHQCEIASEETHICKWSVNHIGPKDNRFIFEVEVFKRANPCRSIIIRDECQYNSQSPVWCKMNKSVLESVAPGGYDYCVRIKPCRQ